MQYLIGFIIGLIIGVVLVLIINRLQRKETEKSFSLLSQEVLRKNSKDFLELANQTLATQTQVGVGELESKRQLIDQTLQTIKTDLTKVEKLVIDTEIKRESTFTAVSTNLKATAEQTKSLQETTNKLQAALANTQIRGQWGERMAEDILHSIGFEEGINYLKQKGQEVANGRPDYSFLLPQKLKLNMDVKFPLTNYWKYFEEKNEVVKDGYKKQFLKDARQRIKEVTTRDYINPAENTLDYALVFVPNEQVFCFINENDKEIMDDALKNKVVLCSPLTLYAMLVVVRQAVDNFRLQETSSQIIALFGTFYKQWKEYNKCMENLGKRIDLAQEEYQTLCSTRSRMLERPLKQIDDLRKQTGIAEAPLAEDEEPGANSIDKTA
ncbi:MAG: DNA recombination protein RmuC [Dehalococcoidales bacterium]|nr:DNA recombination protein RmuC [Dehalococcoidales bacterium]